ncbi:MAG: hypothetical protein ETSY2_33385 [Candidatus Entotheonella gemina]|uniref:Thioredoxin domain-containing protein n=2 Tax=Candidatus Entotheonella TaxID=93171 RepID=W4LZW3_9BACT|nr:MAG: hypothetical protein ETSY2_33385 [Candidatus Entotheonella gemina]
MVFCLVVGQLLTVQAHEKHRHQPSSSPPRETGKAVVLDRITIPDVRLVNQDGEPVHFYRDLVKDKVVAINFVYTTCSTICLPLGANFSKLQQLLHDREQQDVRLISVSVDPVTDTPQRLRAWGEKFRAGPGWSLLTGTKQKVDTLLKALKVFTPDIQDHAPIVMVGNGATETWTRVNGLVSPATLAEMITNIDRVPTHSSAPQEAQRQ